MVNWFPFLAILIAMIVLFIGGLSIYGHIIGRKKAYHCDICCKSFASGSALGGHMGSHKVKKK